MSPTLGRDEPFSVRRWLAEEALAYVAVCVVIAIAVAVGGLAWLLVVAAIGLAVSRWRRQRRIEQTPPDPWLEARNEE